MTSPIIRTSHLTLRVTDLARSRVFYEQALNLQVIGDDPTGRLYMSADSSDTVPLLVLEQGEDTGAAPRPVDPEPYIGMEHWAFELASDDFVALQAVWRRLNEIGAEIHHTIDHRVTDSIYFLDPDRNMIEIYLNAPRARYIQHMDHPYDSLGDIDEKLSG
jgi:catechol-2,3-dioxygenase